jgi:hypothetical protein
MNLLIIFMSFLLISHVDSAQEKSVEFQKLELQAVIFESQKDYSKAISIYEELLQQVPEDSSI